MGFMTIFNVVLITFIIIYGAFFIKFENWSPFLPYGVAGVFQGAAVVFFSYVGFDAVTTLAGEVENTKRDFPIGIVGTLSFVTMLYVAVSLVITGMLPYYKIDVDAGLSNAFLQVGANWASVIVGLGSVTTLSATTFASLLGQPRIFYQMAKDGLFFQIFAKLTSAGVPAIGTIVSGLFALVFAFFLTLGELTDMISIGTLMAFAVVCAGVVILRHQDPKRPTDVPLLMLLYFCVCTLSALSIIYRWPLWSILLYAIPVPIVAISFYIFKVVDIPTGFKTPLVPIVPCLVIYLTYSVRHSKQGIYEAIISKSMNDANGAL